MIAKKCYGLWGMGYAPKIPANQLGKSKSVWPMREYGLYLVCVTRESTVVTTRQPKEVIYDISEYSLQRVVRKLK